MKKYISFWLLLSLALSLGSCQDTREDNLLPNTVYMAQSGLASHILYDIGMPITYNVSVVKAGHHDVAATVTVSLLGQDELTKYNESMGTSYKLMPPSCYTFSEVITNIPADQLYNTLPVIVSTNELKKLTGKTTDYALPIGITSASIAISEDITLPTILNFDVKPAIVSLGLFGENTLPEQEGDTVKIEIPVTIPFDNVWDLACTFDTGKDAFDEYNKTKDGLFSQIPSDAFKIITPLPFVIAKGETNKTLVVEVYKNKLKALNYAFVLKLMGISAGDGSSVIITPDPEKDSYITTVSNAKDISREEFVMAGWKIEGTHLNDDSQGDPDNILDGKLGTFWHSKWLENTPAPSPSNKDSHAWIMVDLGKPFTIIGVNLAPRTAAQICDGYIETSLDKNYWSNVGSFSLEGKWELQRFPVKPTSAQYVKVWITKSYGQLSIFGAQGIAIE